MLWDLYGIPRFVSLQFLWLMLSLLRLIDLIYYEFDAETAVSCAVCTHHPAWHCGEVRVMAPYRAFSHERVEAVLGVHFGLTCLNITLKGTFAGTVPFFSILSDPHGLTFDPE